MTQPLLQAADLRGAARLTTDAVAGIASLVEAMGGRIWVEDAPGGGAEFGFTLRAVELDDHDGGTPLSDAAVRAISPSPAAGD